MHARWYRLPDADVLALGLVAAHLADLDRVNGPRPQVDAHGRALRLRAPTRAFRRRIPSVVARARGGHSRWGLGGGGGGGGSGGCYGVDRQSAFRVCICVRRLLLRAAVARRERMRGEPAGDDAAERAEGVAVQDGGVAKERARGPVAWLWPAVDDVDEGRVQLRGGGGQHNGCCGRIAAAAGPLNPAFRQRWGPPS
jgi:hypothetical protein